MQKIKKLTDKWYSMPEAAKASAAFVISSLLLKGINFITIPIFTRIINTSEYGIIAEYNSWVSIFEVIALLGLTSAGIVNVGLNDYKNSRNQYISSLLTICNTATLLTFVVIFLLKYIFKGNFLLPDNLLILMFIYFIFNPAQIFWLFKQRYEYKYKLATVISIASAVTSQIVSVIFVVNATSDNLAEIKLWSSNLTLMFFSVPIYVYLLIKGRSFFNKDIWKQTIPFALSLIPHYLAQHIMSSADRIMIANLSDRSDAGIYSIVLNIGIITTIVWNSINASLIPYIYEKLNEKNYTKINNAVIPIMLCYALFCVLIAIVAPEIMKILAPDEYYSGIYAVSPVIAASFLTALYNIYANIEFYHKKSFHIALATVISAVVNIALNAALIPHFGFTAAAYTTLISNIVLVYIHYTGYKKSHPEKVYNDKVILLIAIGCIVICEAVGLLYTNSLVRYVLAAAACLLTVIFRKKLLRIIRQLKK